MNSNPTPETPNTLRTGSTSLTKRGKPQPPRRLKRPDVPLILTVPEAAETLRTTPDALRARLRRALVLGPDGSVTAPLAPGIVGVKMGSNTWRIRFSAT